MFLSSAEGSPHGFAVPGLLRSPAAATRPAKFLGSAEGSTPGASTHFVRVGGPLRGRSLREPGRSRPLRGSTPGFAVPGLLRSPAAATRPA